MSKPIRRSYPAARPVRTIPTTPPAGPDSRASFPWKEWAPARPPLDCMNITRGRRAEIEASCRSTCSM